MSVKFKTATKLLKKELEKLDINISNSATLNLLSRTLGYENYNTFKAINGDDIILNITSNNKSILNTEENKNEHNNKTTQNFNGNRFLGKKLGIDKKTQNKIYVEDLKGCFSVLGDNNSEKSAILLNKLIYNLKNDRGSIFVDTNDNKSTFLSLSKKAKQLNKDIVLLDFEEKNPLNTFNVFETFELFDVERIIKDTFLYQNLDKISKKEENLITETEKFLEKTFAILSNLQNNDKTIDLKELIKALSLKAILINLIPEDSNNPNKPDEKLVKLNKLEDYKEYWIPKTFTYKNLLITREINQYIKSHNNDIDLEEEKDIEEKISEKFIQQYHNILDKLSGLFKMVETFDNNVLESTKRNINLKDIIDNDKTLYIKIPTEKHSNNFFNSFVMNSLKTILSYQLNKNTNKELPFLLLFNNIDSYISNNERVLELIIAYCKTIKFNIGFSSKGLHYMNENFNNTNLTDRVMANIDTKIFLNTSDIETLKYTDTFLKRNLQYENSKEVIENLKNKLNYKFVSSKDNNYELEEDINIEEIINDNIMDLLS